MANPSLEDPFHRARILAMLLSLADRDGSVDLDSAEPLWALGVKEEDLWELNQQGAIHFESVGEDGFKPIDICSINRETHTHLQKSLTSAAEQRGLLHLKLTEVLKHDPERLRAEIAKSELHIKDAREQIAKNPILQPLSAPLRDIERHFSSISNVARNYDDVYKNILKPMQDEGRKGIRATVFWAIIGIAASWLLANYTKLAGLMTGAG